MGEPGFWPPFDQKLMRLPNKERQRNKEREKENQISVDVSPLNANLQQRSNRLNADGSKYQSSSQHISTKQSTAGAVPTHHSTQNKHKSGVSYTEGGKLVAAVAPTTTLPQLSNQNELKNSHQKQHHDNDANTLPQLNKKSESYTRQSSYSTINTGTPDRTKRDAYGNKLPMTPGGNDLFMIAY